MVTPSVAAPGDTNGRPEPAGSVPPEPARQSKSDTGYVMLLNCRLFLLESCLVGQTGD